MPALHFDHALLPAGWCRDVRVSIDAEGTVVAVESGVAPEGSETVPGAAVPGVPDLHSHAFQRAMAGLAERGSAQGDSFWGWRERMYRFVERFDPDAVEAVAAQLFSELLRHGFTSVAEFHYLRNAPDGAPYDDPRVMARSLDHAATTAGIGLTLLPVLYRASDFGGVPPGPGQRRFTTTVAELLEDIATLRADFGSRPDRRVGLALHSLRAVGPRDLAEAVRGFADAGGGPVHIHAAEQVREVEGCLRWSGARPVEWLLDHAPVGPDWCLIHATHMTEREAVQLARSGAVVGLCPTTEANLGDGLFPLPWYAEADGVWGVGTDSHVGVSPSAELRLLEYGQRLSLEERNVAAGRANRSTGRRLLDTALRGGAQACGRAVGRIEAGCRADLVVLDVDHAALVARAGDDLLDAWTFSGEDTPVRDVMVSGRWVVREGRHLHQDAITTRFRSTMERLLR